MDVPPIRIVDAIRDGAGTVGGAIGGAILFGAPVTPPMITGIAVIACRVAILAGTRVEG